MCRQYQFADPNRRPDDPGPLEFRFESSQESHPLPNVGDFVRVGATDDNAGLELGRARSRALFHQEMSDGAVSCSVNMVVERDRNINWELLIRSRVLVTEVAAGRWMLARLFSRTGLIDPVLRSG